MSHEGQAFTLPPTQGPSAVHEHMASTPSRETATRIEQDYPLWLVMWGAYSEEYWAYPRFDAPRGTILHSRDPNSLASEMRAMQMSRQVAIPPVSNNPDPRSAPVPARSNGRGPGSRKVSNMQ